MSNDKENLISYDFNLPVFKQGDDLANCLEQTNSPAEAFKLAAELYTETANMCKRMAGIAAETEGMTVDADTHMIMLNVPESFKNRFDSLVEEGFVQYDNFDEDEDI